MPIEWAKKTGLQALGILLVLLGVVGIFLPVFPTAPFLILASWCFSKSSPKLHHWLRTHGWFGKILCEWEDHGVIRTSSKWAATAASIGTVLLHALVLATTFIVPIILTVVFAVVLSFIWTRPSEPRQSGP